MNAATPDIAVDAFLAEVRAEIVRARAKFPGDQIMTLAMAEEFGELCKAVLDEPAAEVRKEAVQAAAMAARVVLDGDSSVQAWRERKGLDPIVQALQAEAGSAHEHPETDRNRACVSSFEPESQERWAG